MGYRKNGPNDPTYVQITDPQMATAQDCTQMKKPYIKVVTACAVRSNIYKVFTCGIMASYFYENLPLEIKKNSNCTLQKYTS